MALIVATFFTRNNSDDPATGLTLTDIGLYLTAVHKTTGARTVIWNGTQNPTAEVNNIGCYIRLYTDEDLDTYDYFGGGLYSGGVDVDAEWVTGVTSLSNAEIWEYVSRTLTQGAASVVDAVTGTEVTVYRGTFWDVTLTGLPDLTDRTEVYLAVKRDRSDSDDDAIVLWSLGTGLERFNGAAATASEGALTVPTNTSVRVTLNSETSQDALQLSGLWYGIKRVAASGEAYASSEGGIWNIEPDTPRAIA